MLNINAYGCVEPNSSSSVYAINQVPAHYYCMECKVVVLLDPAGWSIFGLGYPYPHPIPQPKGDKLQLFASTHL